jgi:hypothetical protein
MSKVENEKIKSLINNQIEQDETSTEHIPSPLSSLHRSASPYRSSHRRLNFIDRPNLILETRNHIPHCGTPRQPLVLRTSLRLVGWVLITLGHSTYLKVRTSVSREGSGLSKTINMVGKLVWKGGTGGGVHYGLASKWILNANTTSAIMKACLFQVPDPNWIEGCRYHRSVNSRHLYLPQYSFTTLEINKVKK